MKKSLILAAVIALSGCSMWNSLNPWAESDTSSEQAVLLPETVNKYLWNASLDKLAYMGVEVQNIQDGRIVTAWKIPAAAPNEKFKAVVEIDSNELRADALNVKVYKEIKTSKGWVKAAPSAALEDGIEQAIIRQAKILYINDKNKD